MKYSMLIILFTLLITCGDDDNDVPDCPEAIGALSAQLNDTLIYTARFTSFISTEPNIACVSAIEIANNCILIGGLVFILEKRVGAQELFPFNSGRTDNIGEPFFNELDDDVILGEFDLFVGEPRSMEITSLTNETIEGLFTATYVNEPGSNNFALLPDTLRFRNISFRAELSNQE